MPYMLEDLVINRVDFVDEGANSAAFIELFKRKEQRKMNFEEILSKMKPEHSDVIKEYVDKLSEDLNKSKEDLATVTKERDDAVQERDDAKEQLNTANEDLENTKSELETLKANNGSAAFDETETMKSMPQEVRDVFEKMKLQKEAAEEEVRKAKEAEKTAEAIAKAKELKAIPYEQDKLVDIIKNANTDVLDLLTVVNAAIEGTVLDEVGKSASNTSGTDAWDKIEAKADEVASKENISKAKAISLVIKENPELYKEYLQGGAN